MHSDWTRSDKIAFVGILSFFIITIWQKNVHEVYLEFFNDWTKGDITALSSAVVALSALILAIWQGITIKKHNVLSLQPLIRFASEVLVSKKGISLIICNHGLGPAIITSMFYVVDNVRYELININGFADLRKNIGLSDLEFGLSCNPKIKGSVIPAGEEITFFQFSNLDGSALDNAEINKRIINSLPKFIVHYKCTYGKCHEQDWSWDFVDNLI